MEKLREILSLKSAELYNRFLVLYEGVVKIYSQGDIVYSGKYGEEHCQQVEENIDYLLPGTIKLDLKADQIFCLLSAIWLHDLELVFKSSSKLHQRALDYLSHHYEDWELDELSTSAILAICKNGQDKTIIIKKELFPSDFFSALFKIADRLDLERLTLPLETPEASGKAKSKGVFSLKERFTSSLRIDSKYWLIEICLEPNQALKEGSLVIKEIYETVKTRLLKDFEAAKEVLERYKLGYQGLTFISSLEEINVKPHFLTGKDSPYKFLNFYETHDKDIFFGRQLEISRFIGLIRPRRLVVIYGEVGVGKTSLINAGLIPELEKQELTVYTRCQPDLLYSIKTAITKKIPHLAHKVDRSETLLNFLRRLPQEREATIFIDQFEGFFRNILEPEQQRIMTELRECIFSESIPVRFVLGLRKELFVQLSSFQEILPQLFSQAYELGLLSPDEAKEAIEKPALLFNITYEHELLEMMISDLKDDNSLIHPLHIQILCHRMMESLDLHDLNDRLPQEIRLEWYDSLGGCQRIISECLDVVIKRLPEGIKEQAITVLKTMAIHYGISDRVRTKDLLSLLNMEKMKLIPLLSTLKEAKLIRKVNKDAYELSSEHLIKVVKERWITQNDLEIKAAIDHINLSLEEWQKHRWLMDINKLSKIYLYRKKLPFSPEGLELLLRSSLKCHFPIYFWIEKLGGSLSQDILSNCLRDADREEIRRIVHYFAQDKARLIRPLLGRLESSEPEIRVMVAGLLAGMRQPEVIDRLLLKLEDTDRDVRLTSALTLGRLIDDQLLNTFLVKLTSTEWEKRELATKVMIELRSYRTLEPLLGRINDSSAEVREAAIEALGNLGNIKALNSIIGRLRDPEARVRIAAAGALGKLKNERSLEPLLQAFNDTNAQVKVAAIKALSQLGDIRAFNTILEMIKDLDLEVRQAAAEAVVTIGGSASFSHLTEKFYRGEWWVREAAAYGLGLLAEERCIEPLLEGMTDHDWRIREVSAYAIGDLKTLNDLILEKTLLQSLREDPNSRVRKACLLSLSRLSEYSLFQSFIQDFHDPDPEVREALSLALSNLGVKEVIPYLISALNDPDERVRRGALAGLVVVDEKIYGQQ